MSTQTSTKKVLIFGDSNTYGYDPREFSDGRYPEEVRWTTLLQNALKDTHEFIVDGMNGRPLPSVSGNHLHLERMIRASQPLDLFVCMLGTNDILLTTAPDAAVPVRRMDHLISWLREEAHLSHILIIAPVYIGTGEDRFYEAYHRQSILMNEGFRDLAGKYGVDFADASQWGVELAYDQVHFSIEGCRTFADHMTALLEKM